VTERVLVYIDLERAGEQLVNRRLAYVVISGPIRRSDLPQPQGQPPPWIGTSHIEPQSISPAQPIERPPARHIIGDLTGATPAIALQSEHGARRCQGFPRGLGGRAALDAVCAPCWSNAPMRWPQVLIADAEFAIPTSIQQSIAWRISRVLMVSRYAASAMGTAAICWAAYY
jgi:hypothetical protein